MSEQKELMDNLKEAGTLVGVSAGIGFIAKKTMKKSVTNDPSSIFVNFAQWVAVITAAIYANDYIKKYIPKT